MTEPRKLSVFLCHSPSDKPSVQDLCKRLSAVSWIDLWLAEERLLPGQERDVEIEKALEAADAIIVHLSKGAVKGEGNVQRELKLALDIGQKKPEGKIFIIPVRSEDCELPRSLETLHPVDYFPNRARQMAAEALLKSLKATATTLGISFEETAPPAEAAKPEPKKKQKTKVDPTPTFPFQKAVVSTAEFPLRGIPFKENKNFTGRKAILDAIRQEFSDGQKQVPAYAVTGLGGMGKTQIGVAYSYQHAQEYDLIWWIRSETQASLAADYQALSNALQLPIKSAAEQSVYVNLVNNWLENTDRKWLLVCDNAESQEQIEPLLPQTGRGHILITSQNPDWQTIAQAAPIPEFSEEEARQFFANRLIQKNTTHADQLTELLGGLPLALEQACAYMNQRGTPMEMYIGLFKEQRRELWQREAAPKDYKATIATTWEMAFQQIRQTQPVAQELLSLFSFFAPDDIPVSLLRSYSAELPAHVAKIVNAPLELEDCLALLYRYSLIARVGELISIHRLVQDVVRDSLDRQALEKWLGAALQIMAKAFPYDEYDVATWSPSARILPHALAAAGHAETHNIGLELASDIYQKSGEYIREQGEYERAEETLQHAVDLRREILGEGHEKLAESLDYLGEIYLEQARYTEGLKLHQQAFAIFETNSDAQVKSIARNLKNLGRVFYEQGIFENARNYYEEALTICRSELGDNHPDTANTLNSIGVLLNEQGNFKDAGKYYEEALAIQRRVLGENHPRTAAFLNNISVLLKDQNSENAKKYNEEALAIQRRILGENHPNTACVLNNLGLVFSNQGDFENARKCYEEALTTRRRTLGKNHPAIANSLYCIGTLLANRSKYVEARPYLEQALAISQKAHGTKHHTLVTILSNLADTMAHLGLYPQAREYAAQAMKICAEAKDKYQECNAVKQLQRSIPLIGKKKHA